MKWALESITTNKASGGDGIPGEPFQILLHSICQQIWKTQKWPQDWKRSVFIPIPKKGNAKEYSNYRTIALISHAVATAAAKSLQSCPTLCDPIDGSPLGSPVPGILQAKTLERVAISSPMRKSELAQSCPTPRDPMDCSAPGSSVHGIFQARVLSISRNCAGEKSLAPQVIRGMILFT